MDMSQCKISWYNFYIKLLISLRVLCVFFVFFVLQKTEHKEHEGYTKDTMQLDLEFIFKRKVLLRYKTEGNYNNGS